MTTADLLSGCGLVAGDAAPAPSLGARPQIHTQEQAVLALRWLMWLRSRAETVCARHEQILQLHQEQFARECSIALEGERMSLMEYADRLFAALQDYDEQQG